MCLLENPWSGQHLSITGFSAKSHEHAHQQYERAVYAGHVSMGNTSMRTLRLSTSASSLNLHSRNSCLSRSMGRVLRGLSSVLRSVSLIVVNTPLQGTISHFEARGHRNDSSFEFRSSRRYLCHGRQECCFLLSRDVVLRLDRSFSAQPQAAAGQ